MKRIFGVLGWFLAAGLLVAAGLLALEAQRQHREIERLTAQLNALPPAASASAPLAETPPPDATLAEATSEAPAIPSDVNAADLLKNLFGGKSDTASSGNPLASMFEGAQGEQMAEMGAQMTVNMQYGDLFRDLGLSPEKEEQMREILKRNYAQMMKSGMSIFQGDADYEQMGDDFQGLQAKLNDELAQVLSKEEMDQFKEYQETLPQKMLEQSYDMQLRMFGGGLTDESRELAKQVLVEELAGAEPDPMGAPNPEELQNLSSIHEQAFARVLERLAPELPEDQYAAVERFVQQQQDMMDAMSGMFDGLLPKPAEEASGDNAAQN